MCVSYDNDTIYNTKKKNPLIIEFTFWQLCSLIPQFFHSSLYLGPKKNPKYLEYNYGNPLSMHNYEYNNRNPLCQPFYFGVQQWLFSIIELKANYRLAGRCNSKVSSALGLALLIFWFISMLPSTLKTCIIIFTLYLTIHCPTLSLLMGSSTVIGVSRRIDLYRCWLIREHMYPFEH